jgi:tRNA (adenine57-N1/adenine58-N1)-methyltransferase
LNLARAIHGANTAAPEIPDENMADQPSFDAIEAKRGAYRKWRADRRAVIHTLDCSGRHSAHAEMVVKNFHRGVYYPHIDFHVGNIDEYLSSRLVETGDAPFLEHTILDLPGIHDYFEIVGKALKPNGSLITFCPSITQINAGVTFARQNNLPLFLERVVEVGAAIGVGGREWDVRPVKPRALLKAQAEEVKQFGNLEDTGEGSKDAAEGPKVTATEASANEEASVIRTPATSDSGWEMICRPKVGLRISGGGFVGVWRRMTDSS